MTLQRERRRLDPLSSDTGNLLNMVFALDKAATEMKSPKERETVSTEGVR